MYLYVFEDAQFIGKINIKKNFNFFQKKTKWPPFTVKIVISRNGGHLVFFGTLSSYDIF